MKAYMIHETGAGDWSKIKYLGKKRGILAAITAFNEKASYSITTDEKKTDVYHWRGSKYGIHSCYENDGRNGILVVIIFSRKKLDQSTLVELVDSYYYANGAEWDELFANLRKDPKFDEELKKIANPGSERDYLSGIVVEEIKNMTPGEMLQPKNFAKIKKLIRKSAQSPYSNRS